MHRITLLTDFGTADGYVGAMKGVIASMAPGVILDDIAHDVRPGDIRAAAWALEGYAFLYPPGTVHLVVVDPGVGTERLAVAARARERFFVLPDNGILPKALGEAPPDGLVVLDRVPAPLAEISATFHGRDVFAPAAARLAAGAPLEELGRPLEAALRREEGSGGGRRVPGGAEGKVVHVDRFGNLISDMPGPWAGEMTQPTVSVSGRTVGGLVRTYGDAGSGELLALVGSRGTIEVAVRDGSAAERLGLGVGAVMELRERSPGATADRR